MDQQRIQNYLNLIQEFLNCPDGQEMRILHANSPLIDEGLVEMMELVAANLAQEGQPNVEWLKSWAAQLAEAIKGWNQLTRQSIELYQHGNYHEAKIVAEKGLELAQKIWGAKHQNVATSLNNIANIYRITGKYFEAKPLYMESLAMLKHLLGEEHLLVAQSLNSLAGCHFSQGHLLDAEAMYLQGLAMLKRLLGEQHPLIATSMNNMGLLYESLGRYSEAEALYKQVLAMKQRLLGDDHSDLATSLNNLAALYYHQGHYLEAEELYLKSWNMRKHLLGNEHPDIAQSLNNLAELYRVQGQYSKAESFCLEALTLGKLLLGDEHPEVATSLNNLANIYRLQGRYSKAEPLYKEALEIRQRLLGNEHPDLAQNLSNIAGLYSYQGHYSEAEQIYVRVKNLREKLLGKDHPDVAASLNNLAMLFKKQGRYLEAEQMYMQALDIWQVSLGEKHHYIANITNNLGLLYQEKKQYFKAEKMYVQAIAIYKDQLKKDHPDVVTSINNLALLYHIQNRYSEARPLYLEALTIRQSLLGNEHPEVAQSLNNLAGLYFCQGCYSEAKPIYLQALAMFRNLVGSDHPDVSLTLSNLAFLFAATEYLNESLSHILQATDINDKMIRNVFAYSSEKDRFAYLKKIRYSFDQLLSLVYNHLSKSPKAVEAAFNLILKRKALTASALAAQNEALYSDRYPHLTEDFHKLRDLSEQIIHLTFSTPQTEDFTTYQQQLGQLQAEHNSLQKKLASQVPEIQLQEQLPNRNDVASELPTGSILIEFVRFDVFNFKAIPAKEESQWQPARYLAFILPAGQPESVEMIDIGEAEYIDNLIREFQVLVSGASKNPESQLGMFRNKTPKLNFREYHPQAGIKLRQAIFDKLHPYLKEHQHLIIAPDGELNLVPFQIIPSDNTGEKMLMDEFTISYLTVGRDILRQKIETKRPASRNALVFASPNFDLNVESVTSNSAQKPNIQTANLRECIANNPLKPAVGTNILGERVAQKLKVASYLGNEALESYFKTFLCPRILLVATHGVFLPNQPENHSPTFLQQRESSLLQRDRFFGKVENPMLRSALALAGANTWAKGGKLPPKAGKGILFAQDIAGLDLWANEITVLSACETAIGDVAIGEGVFGLRRAFAVAGTKTLIMSLWSVNGWTTALLIERFFDNCESGLGRADALQEAQNYVRNITVRELQQFELGREIIKYEFNNGRELDPAILDRQAEDKPLAHPYYWGAWICQGNTKPIDVQYFPVI